MFSLWLYQAGHSVHVAGLMRLDIEESSVDSIYVTVWASPNLPLHMGTTEKACIMLEDHFGRQLKVWLSLAIFLNDLVLLFVVSSNELLEYYI